MMNNRDIYQKDPATRKLVNEGVASVNDEKTSQALAVLSYELETFVCDGEYHQGLARILQGYLDALGKEQKAAWVSGWGWVTGRLFFRSARYLSSWTSL